MDFTGLIIHVNERFQGFIRYLRACLIIYFRMEPEEPEEKKDGGKGTIDVGKEAAIEAEVQAARQRAVVPLEIRMKQFRDMLAEKEVNMCIMLKNSRIPRPVII